MKALRRSSTSSSSNPPTSSSPTSSWIHLRSLLIVASSPVPDRGSLKSPWSRRKRKRVLSHRYWSSLFTPEGKLRDGGYKFLKKVRSGGIDPSIRSEVWPFLLGVYDLNSSELERNVVKLQKRREYENLRRRCCMLANHSYQGNSLLTIDELLNEVIPDEDPQSPRSCDDDSPRLSLFMERNHGDRPVYDKTPDSASCNLDEADEDEEHTGIYHFDAFQAETDSSDSESSVEELQGVVEPDHKLAPSGSISHDTSIRTVEDFTTWQRIIRLDAIRANAEWIIYAPTQAAVSEEVANKSAESVNLKDYSHLEPSMIYHAARLVAVLEAYAVYDPEIGYCQGMSDLLSPILTVMDDDHDAFWCFVGFMRKARHNFRLDEVGIRRQLAIVSRIIRSKDAQFYSHLEKLQAEDCFFVYRMVVVLFRRELTFEQTVCLWEVMWADQAAIRAGIGRSAWGRIRLRAPPTDNLLLYAIAACVLRRRKLIIERYSSMDEIMRECNSMAGQLDVWKLLDDAHDLVVTLHDKV
ncbi:GTPase-activating protein gyp7-like isoform X2 [Phalaenopsis equestris]|uniref:GTPase-activating protein gyp7-like isoform X2 n=1 Tax=Phalaenopsis equestris TaxID=78828 RepID=UPI0009E614BB|nr:GTPase-activating protein gyp7-like isoform X2 [Phalaenopsis equestris]